MRFPASGIFVVVLKTFLGVLGRVFSEYPENQKHVFDPIVFAVR